MWVWLATSDDSTIGVASTRRNALAMVLAFLSDYVVGVAAELAELAEDAELRVPRARAGEYEAELGRTPAAELDARFNVLYRRLLADLRLVACPGAELPFFRIEPFEVDVRYSHQ